MDVSDTRSRVVARGGGRAQRFALPALLLFALAVRCVVALRTSAIFEDGPAFLAIAERFAAGDYATALAHPYHPLYSALCAVARPLFGDFERAALAISVLGGTLAVGAVFVFLREAFEPRAAVLGALLFAISPYAVRFTADVESEGLYLAFFLGGLALLWRGIESGRVGVLFAAGLASGFAYLTRPEGAGLALIGASWLASRRDRPPRRALAAVAALLGGALLVATPYLVVLSRAGDGVVLSGKKSLVRILGLSGDAAAPAATHLRSLPLLGVCVALLVVLALLTAAAARKPAIRRSVSSRAPAVVAGLVVVPLSAWLLFWPHQLDVFARAVVSTLRPEVALLVAIGLWAAREGGLQRRDLYVASVLAAYGIVLVGLLFNYGYLSRRHVLPLLPLVLGYAGLGAVWLAERIRRWPSDRAFAAIAAAMLLIAAPKTLHDHRKDSLAQRLVAEWMREQPLRPGLVASSKRRTGYYAGRKWVPLLENGALRPLERLAHEDVRYIVADDQVLGDRERIEPPPGFGLRELHRIAAGGRTAEVFELVRTVDSGAADIAAAPPERATR